ncbi:hypothetical protein ACSBR2_018289 [Camellia fascicularis]
MASMHSTICFLSLFLALHFFSTSLAKISSSLDAVCNSTPYPFFCQSIYLTLPNGLSQPTIRALKDCQSLFILNMDFLSTTVQSIDSTDTLQSAIITNHQTCSYGLQATTPSSSIQNNFLSPFDNGNKLYSISLALFKYSYIPKTRKGRWLAKRESMLSKKWSFGSENVKPTPESL